LDLQKCFTAFTDAKGALKSYRSAVIAVGSKTREQLIMLKNVTM
jgi:hypothetical protein